MSVSSSSIGRSRWRSTLNMKKDRYAPCLKERGSVNTEDGDDKDLGGLVGKASQQPARSVMRRGRSARKQASLGQDASVKVRLDSSVKLTLRDDA
eukprot:CAMPEP_0113583608 /NCGR_PEP_ID=MMETSP0015_2-20120614/32618_1 /TAXON_ID=2838 /ORGANISM="Odontella" /LENGTH=94 /DNA_ID=CAMNT_0000488517 /DNA_START=240 /DNA_END=524 /DNA_ORIENTATION=- /assembly_acc=CAM_ASM_000160